MTIDWAEVGLYPRWNAQHSGTIVAIRGGVRMCWENTQKPQIPHCWCRWKDPTKPNHFISANSPSYCGKPLRYWVPRCHTTNWESQQGPLFGPLHRLCTATVITTIIWLPETSNARVEAAGICISPFDLGDLNKASSHSVKGVKVKMSCSPLSACRPSSLNHLYCHYYFGYKSNRAIKIRY